MAMLLSFLSFLSLSFSPDHSLVGEAYRYVYDDQYNNGFPESQYHLILDKVMDVYGPMIQKQKGELRIVADWTDGAVNMWAERWGETYILEIPGGMSRYHLINEVAFIVSICHELGHLLGGEPANGVISLEGQSDFFSNQECSTLLLKDHKLYKEIAIEDEVRIACSGSAAPASEVARREGCVEILAGSRSLTSYFAELEGSPIPSLLKKDTTQVSQTMSAHPKAQCRLDTMKSSFEKGKRPQCWFHP